MLATTFDIEELTVPATLDEPAAAGFIEMVQVRNAIETSVFGTDALAVTPAELLPVYTTAFEPKRIFVARVDGRIVGRSLIDWSKAAGSESSWLFAEVLPEFRRRGIGSALFDKVESLALQSNRPVLQCEALHRPVPGGDRIAAPTGYGDLSAQDPGARFLGRRETGSNRSNASAFSTCRSIPRPLRRCRTRSPRRSAISTHWSAGPDRPRRSGCRRS